MIATLIQIAFRNRLTASISTLVIAGLLLFGWHKIDKTSAVRQAVAGYVADVELTAAQAQIAEARRRAQIAEDARGRLDERLVVLEGVAVRQAREIEQYEAEYEPPDGCVVDRNVFKRLRGN